MLNRMMMMGLAYDFTQDRVYLDNMVESMDYLLGRNPLNKSYISGYGENPLEHPHHRFWGNQPARGYPAAAAGRGRRRTQRQPIRSGCRNRRAWPLSRRQNPTWTPMAPIRPMRWPSTGMRRWLGPRPISIKSAARSMPQQKRTLRQPRRRRRRRCHAVKRPLTPRPGTGSPWDSCDWRPAPGDRV